MPVSLVTGGAGFIGSYLVEVLVKRGHVVRVLDNCSTGTLANLAGVRSRVELVLGDLTCFELVRRAVRDVEYIFHEAAAPPMGGTDGHLACTIGTEHVLRAAHKERCRRVVYASSAMIYGWNGLPKMREEGPSEPVTRHGRAKLVGEEACVAYTRDHGLSTVRLRLFNVFGPRQADGSPVATEVFRLLEGLSAGTAPVVVDGPGRAWDLLYVDDAVHAHLLAADGEHTSGRVYNIARGRMVNPSQVAALIHSLLGTGLAPVAAPMGDAPSGLTPDITRAETELGFSPATSLEQGLRHCIDYYARLKQAGAELIGEVPR
ncbi:MAG: NAD-dependent epimerase/dehydratase family protein [Gemmataceae bacterium]|nr:NAD-dependent epimerase/dehydratase family protein [Gemmataceae bacterium]